MLDHGHDIHLPCLRSGFVADQLDETYQRVAKIRADEDAAIETCRFLLTHRIDVLLVMAEWPYLTDRTLVVDLPDSLHECVIERNFPQGHSLFLGFLCLFLRF